MFFKLFFKKFSVLINRYQQSIYRYLIIRHLKKINFPNDNSNESIMLVDGIFDNPNHYIRLRLIINALRKEHEFKVVAIISSKNKEKPIKLLKSINVNNFLYIDDLLDKSDKFEKKAKKMLSNVKDHKDLLRLKLSNNIPAYVYYDTVLHEIKNARPSISSSSWEKYLIEFLKKDDFFKSYFKKNKIKFVFTSHAWKANYAIPLIHGIINKLPSFHVTVSNECIRIRNFKNMTDFKMPRECITYDNFKKLPISVQKLSLKKGKSYLKKRFSGKLLDINVSHAFNMEKRIHSKKEALNYYGLDTRKPTCLICNHAWWDFPHCLNMTNFVDFIEWLEVTYEVARKSKNINWLFKPHPLENWYGGLKVKELFSKTPKNIKILNSNEDSFTALNVSDFVITMFGTVGYEAATQNKIVINGDKSHYEDWDVSYTAKSKKDYIGIISNLETLKRKSKKKLSNAYALAYFTADSHPKELNLLKYVDDTNQKEIYKFIKKINFEKNSAEYNEIEYLSNWLKSPNESYASSIKVNYLNKFS